jgi:tetratricopeptide (TPR) repeat protein
LQPGDAAQADFFMSRGRVYERMGNYEVAQADYQRAATLGSQ